MLNPNLQPLSTDFRTQSSESLATLSSLIGQYRLPAPVYITQTHLPNLSSFTDLLKVVWKKRWVTNNGDLASCLESALCKQLDTPHISLVCNGTLALMLALHTLRITGEVITTPFTFPATTNVLHWKGITPVFCDIDENTFNIDSNKIESLITPRTTALLPVHLFGNPCDVEAIEHISKRHGLRVVYDAAQAFGVKLGDKSISNFGDISAFSFHATKLFHTVEGGALAVSDSKLKATIDGLRNFGIVDEETVAMPGINAKLNELQAAVGLLELKHVGTEINNRRKLFRYYLDELADLPGLRLPCCFSNVTHNYSYFPILIDKNRSGISRDDLYASLQRFNIFPRKYFYPLTSNYPFFASLPSSSKANLPVANKIAESILCLPLYGGLDIGTVKVICAVIRRLIRLDKQGSWY